MRISDWSSDVCSSDLAGCIDRTGYPNLVSLLQIAGRIDQDRSCAADIVAGGTAHLLGHLGYQRTKAGRTGSRYLARIVSRAARLIVVAIGCRGDSVPADSAGDGGRRLSARGGAFRVASHGSGDCYSCITYRSEEHTSELQSLMRLSYAVFCL